ncbi:MAG: CHAT domain-containing protein, partial [Bacteroidota bacterium]
MPAVPAEMDQVLPILLLAFANESKVSTRYLRSLDAEREQIIAGLEAVNQQLTQAGKRPVFELKVLSQANIHQIFDAFSEHGSRIAAFHFSGHADGYQLLLESTDGGPPHIAHAGGLVSFFRQQPHLKLVFLNGCSTFQQTKELADEGIPSVIGTDREIQDEVAAQFATRLYRSLALGAPIGQAFHAAATLVESLEGRGLMRSLELEETEDALAPSRGIPWELFSNEPDWNLGSEANNPLLGLPEPILARKPKAERPDPPANPFRYLDRYQAEHSEVFFGRGQEIRQFFSLLSTQLRSSLLLLHGQSGVGKSSFLEAGIFPRLSGYTQVVYVRRDVTLQLRDSLLAALPENAEGDTLTERVGCMLAHHAWNDAGENPFFPLPKVVLLVDQAEESFTRQQPNARPEVEWREFLKAIAPLVLHPELRQEVRVVLSFRKGYLAEIKGFCLASGLPWEDVFMRPLNQRGIEEIITGGTSSQRLRDAYQLEMELGSRAEDKHLPNLIAGDLLENKETAIAPILQILLSRMWEGTETQFQQSGKRFWSIADYQRNKRAGMLMKDFLDQQLSLLAQHPDFHHAASNGLALDVLTFHTTSLGTADQRSWAEIEEHYGTDRSDLR